MDGGAHARAERAFGPAVLPLLLERVRMATALVRGVDARVRADPATLCTQAAAELEQVDRASDELGWLLGVIGRELGADLLRARQERAGLEPLLALVRVALERGGRAVRVEPAPLPEVEPACGVLVELCAWIAELLWLSGQARGGVGAVLEVRPHALTFTGATDARLDAAPVPARESRRSLSSILHAAPARGAAAARMRAAVAAAAEISPLLAPEFTASGWRVTLPAGWLTGPAA